MGETQKFHANKLFFLRYEKTEQWRKDDKKCFALADKHEIEEEEDDETNKKCDELKMKKRKGVNIMKRR